jgi:hypothetical protein
LVHLRFFFYFFLKIFFAGCRPDRALGKRNTKKIKKTLCRVPRGATPGKEIIKKIKNLCRVPPGRALGKEKLEKKLKNLCRVLLTWHPAKKL